MTVLPENFKDTWRYSAGVNYYYDDKTVLRAGVAYDQSPVNNIDRVAAPARQRPHVARRRRRGTSIDSALNFDVGAAYIWVKNGSINNSGNPAPALPPTASSTASYNNHVVIVSGRAQLPVEVGRRRRPARLAAPDQAASVADRRG